MPTSSHNASGRLWIPSNTYRSVNGTASTHRLLSGHAQFSCPFNCSIRLGYLRFHRISHRGQLHSCSWDPTHLLSSVNAQKHSAAVSIDSLSLPGGALALQQSLIQPSPRVECLDLYPTSYLLFTVGSHEAAERIQNHPQNVRGQPAVSPLFSLGELPGRNSLGGEPGGHQADGCGGGG